MDDQLEIFVWELLKNHQSVVKLKDTMDVETHQKALRIAANLNQMFSTIEKIALSDLDLIPRDIPLDDQYQMTEESLYPLLVVKMLNQEPYADYIWGMVKPREYEVQSETTSV